MRPFNLFINGLYTSFSILWKTFGAYAICEAKASMFKVGVDVIFIHVVEFECVQMHMVVLLSICGSF